MEQEGANIRPTRIYRDKYAEQVVLVSGAARGIGRVTATLFADQGANVVLVDLDEQELKRVEAQLTSDGRNVTYRVANLASEEHVNSMINEVVSSLGRIDVLVHIAGIYPFCPLLEQSTPEYKKVMSVNMDSSFYLTRAVLPHMQKAGYGRIINTASGTASHPEAGLAVYAASKSAVVAFTRATATEAGPGVTANVVAPGLVVTETTWSSPHARPIFDKAVERQCVKRYGQPKDVAQMISFIASPEAEFITGQLFHVSGGMIFD
ncbi:(S)-1-Phenylethanol dehydrogenase [Cladophialophora carrionii]|uniref:(S)-1-Phenylethanol dehydrogenase n=1 Tax=Cladophialophora carrionii TaxID=86049 RepID=A0A1C1CHU6_9EURO|nr:(S)-1-Phenylethanol dehydrogenase [Cladophialophora carrionii]